MGKPDIYVITGNSSGLGFELLKLFLSQGLNVGGFSKSPVVFENPQTLNASQFWDQRVGDVTNVISVQDFFHHIEANYNIRAVVHCAAIVGPLGTIEENDSTQWEMTIRVNLLGTFNVIQNAVSVFRKQGFGNFIALSGGGATTPMPSMTAYAASKTAVVRLIESVSQEHLDTNITFNCVAPGQLPTKMIHQQLAAGKRVLGNSYYEKIQEQSNTVGNSFSKPLELIYQLSTAIRPQVNGKLISAVWDEWVQFFGDDAAPLGWDELTLRRTPRKNQND